MFIPLEKSGGEQWIYIIDKDRQRKINSKLIISDSYGMITDVESQLNQKNSKNLFTTK